MLKKHFEKNKQGMFPWITDWSDPQNHKRNDDNIRAMSWGDWFFFHPSAYLLMTYGSRIITIVLYLSLGIYCSLKEYYVFSVILLLAIIITSRDLYNQTRNHELNKQTNYYDLWLREYK